MHALFLPNLPTHFPPDILLSSNPFSIETWLTHLLVTAGISEVRNPLPTKQRTHEPAPEIQQEHKVCG